MLISNIINDSFGLLSKQLKFYYWHYKRDLDQRQQQELIDILNEQYFERLANKIKSLVASDIADCKQQIGKLLFEQCLASHRRHQLIQLIESDLVDINVRLDNYGRTLLHRTAYNLDVELVKLLIDHGVNIYLRDYAGSTALHIAIQSYRNGGLIYNNEPEVVQNLTQIIRLLLEADKNLQKSNEFRIKRLKFESHRSAHENVQATQEKNFTDEESDDPHIVELASIDNANSVSARIKTRRDRTICQIIGSHCLCRNDKFEHEQQRQLQYSANNESTHRINRKYHQDVNIENEEPASLYRTRIMSRSKSKSISVSELEQVSLVNTKNAFGRTPLHYCVLVVGERYLDQIVELLLSHGADPDIIDTRMKTPLYHLVKRSGVTAVRQKCLAIKHLIEFGCDDLGLAIEPKFFFSDPNLKELESNMPSVQDKQTFDDKIERIFTCTVYKRVPSLKHLTRLALIKANDEKHGKLGHQIQFALPDGTPNLLNLFVNKKLLDQSELF